MAVNVIDLRNWTIGAVYNLGLLGQPRISACPVCGKPGYQDLKISKFIHSIDFHMSKVGITRPIVACLL